MFDVVEIKSSMPGKTQEMFLLRRYLPMANLPQSLNLLIAKVQLAM